MQLAINFNSSFDVHFNKMTTETDIREMLCLINPICVCSCNYMYYTFITVSTSTHSYKIIVW